MPLREVMFIMCQYGLKWDFNYKF